MDGLHGWILLVFDPKDSSLGFFVAVNCCIVQILNFEKQFLSLTAL